MIIYGADEAVCEWVSLNLGSKNMFGKARGLAVVKDNKVIAGVVYNNYTTDINNNPLNIEMSIFSIDKSWATRQNLKELFAYPFIQLGLKRVTATSSVNAEGVNIFLQKLGFTREGLHRNAYVDGSDAYSWGLLKQECRWINEIIAKNASSTRPSSDRSCSNGIK